VGVKDATAARLKLKGVMPESPEGLVNTVQSVLFYTDSANGEFMPLHA